MIFCLKWLISKKLCQPFFLRLNFSIWISNIQAKIVAKITFFSLSNQYHNMCFSKSDEPRGKNKEFSLKNIFRNLYSRQITYFFPVIVLKEKKTWLLTTWVVNIEVWYVQGLKNERSLVDSFSYCLKLGIFVILYFDIQEIFVLSGSKKSTNFNLKFKL